MTRLIGNTRKELIRRYYSITHRIGQYYNSTYTESVLIAQMNAHEVAMLEGELKEIKIKMSLLGMDEPVMAGSGGSTSLSNRYLKNANPT